VQPFLHGGDVNTQVSSAFRWRTHPLEGAIMSCNVGGATHTPPASEVEKTNPTSDKTGANDPVKETYDAGKESIKAMDDVLQQAEDAQPGDDPNIQKAREELKDVDEGMDEVFNSTKELEEAHKSGDPAEIEEKFLAANEAQADFADQYQEMSEAMEKVGFKIPPLEQ
jgi:hypothetical protein